MSQAAPARPGHWACHFVPTAATDGATWGQCNQAQKLKIQRQDKRRAALDLRCSADEEMSSPETNSGKTKEPLLDFIIVSSKGKRAKVVVQCRQNPTIAGQREAGFVDISIRTGPEACWRQPARYQYFVDHFQIVALFMPQKCAAFATVFRLPPIQPRGRGENHPSSGIARQSRAARRGPAALRPRLSPATPTARQ